MPTSVSWSGRALCAALVCGFLLGTSTAAPIVAPVGSSFDDGLDGWTSNKPAEVSWAATGGNPGGYVRFEDATVGNTYLYAPEKFLGDWRPYNDVGILLYDFQLLHLGSYLDIRDYSVSISGPGGTAQWTSPGPEGLNPWECIVILMTESTWQVTSGSWTGALADVQELSIMIELVAGLGSAREDISGIDNVALVPEPASLILLSLMGLALARHRRAV